MTESLRELLAVDLVSRLDISSAEAPRRVLLWLDPDQGFERVWPSVAEELATRHTVALRCEAGTPGQFATKIALLRSEGEGVKVVVYLPGSTAAGLEPKRDGSAPDLWSVYDYRYKGEQWSSSPKESGGLTPSPTLADWLQLCGVNFATSADREALVDGDRDSMLARYAEVKVNTSPSDWPQPLRESDVIAVLGGDPRDALRQLLAAPTNALKALEDERDLVFTSIGEYFGLEVPAVISPEELADSLTVQMALAEAWDAFGRRTDFPFRSRLPEDGEQRNRVVQFARNLLRDVELAPRFRTRMLRLEKDYDLSEWSSDGEGQPAGLPVLARSRWQNFLSDFDALAASDWKSARDMVLSSATTIEAGRSTPWGREEGDTPWFVMGALVELLLFADRVQGEVDTKSSVGELVDVYRDSWWNLDRIHLRVRAATSRMTGLERVRRVADLAYFGAVEPMSYRLSELLVDTIEWPPEGSAPAAGSMSDVLWSVGKSRRGVLVVDALRFDLGMALREGLGAELEPVFTTLPSTTPFGMTAFLPPADCQVAVDPKVSIKAPGGANLAAREGRKAFLAERLVSSGGKSVVDFTDLDDLLRGAPVPNAQIVVVFDNTIDEQGHKGTEEFPWVVEQLVAKLRRAVERLHEAGIPEVHVVTDHGFLLLPEDMVNGLGGPEVKVGQALRRETRWAALKPEAPVHGLIRLPLPISPDIELGFPFGTRTLVKSGDFVHGGISLQEVVIPHLVSRAALGRLRVGVEITVTTDQLVGGTVPVILRPTLQGQMPLGDVLPSRVSFWVEEAAPAARRVTDAVEIEVRSDAEELKPPLYLMEGLGLRAGEELVLRAVEAETGEDLAAVPLSLNVDWD